MRTIRTTRRAVQKGPGCKVREVMRNEACICVRRNDRMTSATQQTNIFQQPDNPSKSSALSRAQLPGSMRIAFKLIDNRSQLSAGPAREGRAAQGSYAVKAPGVPAEELAETLYAELLSVEIHAHIKMLKHASRQSQPDRGAQEPELHASALCISVNIQGLPSAPRATITPSHPVRSSISRACALENTSPLPITGIESACFTCAMMS